MFSSVFDPRTPDWSQLALSACEQMRTRVRHLRLLLACCNTCCVLASVSAVFDAASPTACLLRPLHTDRGASADGVRLGTHAQVQLVFACSATQAPAPTTRSGHLIPPPSHPVSKFLETNSVSQNLSSPKSRGREKRVYLRKPELFAQHNPRCSTDTDLPRQPCWGASRVVRRLTFRIGWARSATLHTVGRNSTVPGSREPLR